MPKLIDITNPSNTKVVIDFNNPQAKQKIINAFCDATDYSASSGISKEDHFSAKIVEYLKNVYKGQAVAAAAKNASKLASDQVDLEF